MPERDDPLLTRETLLLRLRDPEDGRSWAEFAEVYTPLLYGYCANRGLAHADAADVVQGVMQSVAKAIRGFDYDPGRGRFKGWLFTIVRRAIAAHARGQARQPATPGETQVMAALDAEPDRSETDRWERDYQRRLLAWAMEKIRPTTARASGRHSSRRRCAGAIRRRSPPRWT
ncbi:MAG: sigma-70 family RNA polymerase sigma factor [Verrucomicrobiales bacterium]